MNELEIWYLDLKFEQRHQPKIIQIVVMQEDQCLEFQKVYESRVFEIAEKPQKRLVVHEDFNLLSPAHKGMFLKIVLRYKQSVDKNSHWIERNGYMFYKDLSSLKDGFSIKIDKLNKVTVRFNARLATPMNESPRISTRKSKDATQPEVEDPDLLEMFKISKMFMKKVTPIRRLADQVEGFFLKENLRRDIKVYLWLLVWFFYGRYLLFGVAAYLLFTDRKYRVRLGFIAWGMGFFEPEEPGLETKRNINFLKNQQVMMINLSSGLRSMFFSKNRRIVFGLSTFSVPIIVTIGLIHFLTMGQFMAALIFYLLTLKYKKRMAQLPKIPLLGYFKYIGKLYAFNFWKWFGHTPKIKKFTKSYFIIENQRWFMREGFTSARLPFGKLMRSSAIFRHQRKAKHQL